MTVAMAGPKGSSPAPALAIIMGEAVGLPAGSALQP